MCAGAELSISSTACQWSLTMNYIMDVGWQMHVLGCGWRFFL